jgi:hypothetical protein
MTVVCQQDMTKLLEYAFSYTLFMVSIVLVVGMEIYTALSPKTDLLFISRPNIIIIFVVGIWIALG